MLKTAFKNWPLLSIWQNVGRPAIQKNMTIGSRSTGWSTGRSTVFNRDQTGYSRSTARPAAIGDRSIGRSTENVHNMHTPNCQRFGRPYDRSFWPVISTVDRPVDRPRLKKTRSRYFRRYQKISHNFCLNFER